MASLERAAAELEAAGRRLKAAGDSGKGLKQDTLRSIRESAKPTTQRIRARAAEVLPKRGGLAAQVARAPISVRTRLTGSSVGVSLVRKQGRRFEADGRLRHPVYGNQRVYVQQRVRSGWFSETVEKDADRIRGGIEDTARRVAREIEG